jgi:DNA-binding response OmpR family regulator
MAMADRRMLIVEDEPTARSLMARIFSRRGWAVAAVGTVADGLAALGGAPPDCLVLDLMLPDGDGADLLRRVRSEGLPSRVVVATGFGDPARIMGVAALRPDAVIRKPFDPAGIARPPG